MALATPFDYVIVGGGMSGLQLAKAFIEDSYFNNFKIAVIEPKPKKANDKIWSFWEKGSGQWDTIATKTWNKGQFFSDEIALQFDLSPYIYKTIRSIDFYTSVKHRINQSKNCTWISDSILEIKENAPNLLLGKQSSYKAKHVFDSRILNDYTSSKNTTTLLQHFKGWIIETDTPQFDSDTFTMMDYRLIYKDTTSFTYVLPFSKTKALIEYTFFSPKVVANSVYDTFIKNYCKDVLNISNYTVNETEQGVIPMTTYNFHQHNKASITKIGTAGGWVKPSSGYSFKITEGIVQHLIENIKANKSPHYNLGSARHDFYDRIFLQVLHDNNAKGPQLFERFYKRNVISDCFTFLDNKSSLWQELKIIWSLKSWKFVLAFFKSLKQ